MSYARRTCHKCGMVKPLNLMHSKEITKQVGHTKDKLTGGTLVGAFLFEQKVSKNRIKRRLFANNKRSHYRQKEVWECYPGTCHMDKRETEDYIISSKREAVELKDKKTSEPEVELTPKDYVICGSIMLLGVYLLYKITAFIFSSIASFFSFLF